MKNLVLSSTGLAGESLAAEAAREMPALGPFRLHQHHRFFAVNLSHVFEQLRRAEVRRAALLAWIGPVGMVLVGTLVLDKRGNLEEGGAAKIAEVRVDSGVDERVAL
jgi:hypothetical protein